MPILVVCPGCKKSFTVADKFAGKTGPCPKCKTVISVPAVSEEVQIHAPEEFSRGGRGVSGRLALKPIARTQVKIRPVVAGAVAAGVVVFLAVLWLCGGLLGKWPIITGTTGLLLLSPILAMVAYTFLRDDEKEPYRGRGLALRTAACSAIYVILWGVFVYVKASYPPDEIWQWFVIAPPFLILGSMTAWLSFDLEPTNGFFHYSFYVLVTVLLARIAGLGWAWAT
jgi:hypothetical protein